MWFRKKKENKKLSSMKPIKKAFYNKETEKIVEDIFEGKYFLLRSLDILEFKKGIDWAYEHEKSAKTYQLYLHSLEPINYLCVYYEKTKDKKSLKKAYEILLDWMKHDAKAKEKETPFRWTDHATANRVLAVINFYTVARGNMDIDEDAIYSLLENHARFLNDDNNYRKNNHGIMADRALVSAALALSSHSESESWKEKAIYRLREAFSRDFSYKGVHLENSPDYHSIVRRLFMTVEKFLKENQLTLGKDITERMKTVERYFQYAVKPNQKVPSIGDTSTVNKMKTKKLYESFIDEEAGIAYLQQMNEENPANSTWISFICGYGSSTHKHRDDLSFNLYYNGHDIFVDSGKYNNSPKDKIKQYMLSPFSHNTLAVTGKTYDIKEPLGNRDKIKITGYYKTELYEIIKGMNHAYQGIKLERSLLFVKPDMLFVFDQAVSEEEQEYIQLFNLAPKIKTLDTKDNVAIIKSADDVIEITQQLGTSKVERIHADRSIPRAVISERFNTLIDTSQLKFTKKGKNVQFLTVIHMGNENVPENITFDESLKVLTLKKNGQSFNIAL